MQTSILATASVKLILLLALALAPIVPVRAADARCFPETGACLGGRFLQFWETHGGLPVYGLPLAPQQIEANHDTGRSHPTQWLERNRLEHHPDNQAPYDVLLGRLGVDRLRQLERSWEQEPHAESDAPHFFSATGHAIAFEPFWRYWSTHGLELGDPGVSERESLALFGYPLTEPRMETNANGDAVLTQWFERARFEHHPDNPAAYRVLLGRLGAELREATARFVAPWGDDAAEGSPDRPWRTIGRALKGLDAGDTLFVRGGVYQERIQYPSLVPATAEQRITVKAYPGERPVLVGLLWLRNLRFWTFSGLNVTWHDASGAPDEHMVKLVDGTGWAFTNAEVWGARSFAAILVAGAPSQYVLSRLFVHDTVPSNAANQDHLIYVNTAPALPGGVIERCLLLNSPNGRAIKVGPPTSESRPVGGVTIRYNTMYNNLGPSNIELSYGASNTVIYRNIMQRVASGNTNIGTYRLSGRDNVASDNIGWESAAVLETGLAGLADGGGNLSLDPRFRDPDAGDFRPGNAAAIPFGHLAP